MAQFIARIIRAAKLEPRLYDEVETDTDATWQGVGVVLLSSLAAGIGSSRHTGLGGLVVGGLVALIAWYLWAFLTYLIGAKLFPMSQTSVSHREVWRTLACQRPRGAARLWSRARVHWRGISGCRCMDAHRCGHCGAAGMGLYEYGPRAWCVPARLVRACIPLTLPATPAWPGGIKYGLLLFSQNERVPISMRECAVPYPA